MHPRSDTHGSFLQVRAMYSIPALARLANISTHMLRRVLRANGITFVRARRAMFVPLTEIQEKIPPLWRSICAVAEVLAAAARAADAGGRSDRS